MKPYAYAVVQGNDNMENISLQFDHPEMCGQTYRQAIPLYTHPVKESVEVVFDGEKYTTTLKPHPIKQLSDEEIVQISHQSLQNSALIPKDNFMIEFARAIIKEITE